MRTAALPADCDDAAFRLAARRCLAAGLPPEQVVFTAMSAPSFFDAVEAEEGPAISVPRAFAELVSQVLCHTAEDRFALLYRLLWRLHGGERQLLEQAADVDVLQARRYARQVEKDVYRMHAFVRFSERTVEGELVYTAWFEPQYRVLRRAAPFFVDRFANMDWLIATPFGTAAWHGGALAFGAPAARPAKAEGDPVLDELWTRYYRATFNPTRLRVKAMQAQMPKRHWPTMPETALVSELVASARPRVAAMMDRPPDAPPRFAAALANRPVAELVVPRAPLELLRREASDCRRCPLHGPATQTVFGEGPADVRVMFVGEQPGDQEDLAGRPFVGPAGRLFDQALAEAGIDRGQVYVTNAVKHFKFEPRGKRRIHSKPGTTEVSACRFWLERELATVAPQLVVALGATAVAGLTGRAMAVTKERGRIRDLGDGRQLLVTVHPSYLLRLPDPAVVEAEYRRFVADLRLAAPWCSLTATQHA